MGYEITNIFAEEGKSAKNLNRPELQRMLKYIKQNRKKINALVFWKWDRLSRGDDSDYVELAKIFGKAEITTLSTRENNDTTPIAKFARKITQAVNSYELDVDSERTTAGLRRKAEEGHFPGKAPIGYLNKKDERDKGFIVVDELASSYIKRIFKY